MGRTWFAFFAPRKRFLRRFYWSGICSRTNNFYLLCAAHTICAPIIRENSGHPPDHVQWYLMRVILLYILHRAAIFVCWLLGWIAGYMAMSGVIDWLRG